ncbi:hypothetical protein [Streptomyces luteocolor]|uniref:hypothetical protein n=1 Tax=Streptomyces luteocolor TaxID=285500 RepID=UPI000853B270|nr:hypothetical protein [Streptomyces luteocolor]
MAIIGPGYDDPEYDGYDPAWRQQNTPFRRWLEEGLAATGMDPAMATLWAPVNRYNGLDGDDASDISMLTDTTVDDVHAAHKADLAHWAHEQQLRDHPDLAAVDADLDRITRRN